jgi:hypothetical protein
MFDLTVGSRSNIYTSFQMQFSSGYLLNRYSVPRRFGRPILRKVQKGDNVSSHSWIALTFSHEFPDAVFLGVATEQHLGNEEVWSANLE